MPVVGTGHCPGCLVVADPKLTANPLDVPFLTTFAVFLPTFWPHVAPPV